MQSKRKNTAKKKKSKGAPEKYNPKFHLPLAKYMCMCGAIDKEIAKELGIVTSTLYEWKKKYPEFNEVLQDNKAVADAKVEQALYDRALGIEYEEVTKVGKKTKKVTKYLAGDTTAQIFWLKNRKPQDWRDKQEVQHSGNLAITGIEYIVPEKPKENEAAN